MRHKADGLVKYQREFSAVDYIHSYGLDPEKREIYLFGREEFAWAPENEGEPGIEYALANQFIKNLRILQSINSDPILVHMKTSGGDWAEGIAIYQAIKACPNFCCILNYTHARSMSSIILQAADYRVMMPLSVFMYHDGTIGVDGTVRQFWTEAEQLKNSSQLMMDIYIENCEGAPAFIGKSRKQIERHMRTQMDKKEEVYLTAEETVAHGFADKVFGEDNVYDWDGLRNG